MKLALRLTCAVVAALALVLPVQAQDKEKDIFNYAAQKSAARDVKKIVFIADAGTHGGKGNHEFKAGAIYLARALNAAYPNCYAVVHLNTRWPKDLAHADAVIVLLNHGGKAATDPAVQAAMERGAGFGFTGFHNYSNLTNDNFRTLLLNAAAWTAKLEVPANGVQTKTPTPQEMETYYQDGLRLLQMQK